MVVPSQMVLNYIPSILKYWRQMFLLLCILSLSNEIHLIPHSESTTLQSSVDANVDCENCGLSYVSSKLHIVASALGNSDHADYINEVLDSILGSDVCSGESVDYYCGFHMVLAVIHIMDALDDSSSSVFRFNNLNLDHSISNSNLIDSELRGQELKYAIVNFHSSDFVQPSEGLISEFFGSLNPFFPAFTENISISSTPTCESYKSTYLVVYPLDYLFKPVTIQFIKIDTVVTECDEMTIVFQFEDLMKLGQLISFPLSLDTVSNSWRRGRLTESVDTIHYVRLDFNPRFQEKTYILQYINLIKPVRDTLIKITDIDDADDDITTIELMNSPPFDCRNVASRPVARAQQSITNVYNNARLQLIQFGVRT